MHGLLRHSPEQADGLSTVAQSTSLWENNIIMYYVPGSQDQ